MSIDLGVVQLAVRKAIGSPDKPSPDQVSVICRMSYFDVARKEIQRMIDRRLRYPDTYGPLEVFHTLILLQNCLFNASTEFVDFCTSQVQLVVSLERYERIDTSIERDKAGLVRSQATALSKYLLDPVGLAEKRRAISAGITASTTAPPPTTSRPVPLPTLPASPEKPGKSPSAPLVTPSLGRPPLTPDPTPPTPLSQLGQLIFSLKKEDVAAMTFRSGKDGLEKVLCDLNDILTHSSNGRDLDELVNALTCVHHCLYWGSDSFTTHCFSIKNSFNPLRQHFAAQVRGHADAVVHLLDSRLQEERQIRASLLPRITTTPSPRQSIRGDIVREPVSDISKSVTKIGTKAVAGGGYSDVWKGKYTRAGVGKEIVAIKFLRRLSRIPKERFQKRLNRELRVWRDLRHRNISPFYGIIVDADVDVGMVSPYYFNGNVLEYVQSNADIDPLQMLRGIADGVAYLHFKKIVHGDVKCANVMVDLEGTPKLIDFGLAQIIDEFAEATGYTTTNLASSLRWAAPELLIGDFPDSPKTEKSDIYAFASTCIEIMTLKCPYFSLRDGQVIQCVIEGQPPERPPLEAKWSPCDELWEFLQTCWKTEPRERPDIVAVKRNLAGFFDGVAADKKPIT